MNILWKINEKNGILKDYLMFICKKNPEYGEITSNFDQKVGGQFYRYEFSYFSHEFLLEYENKLAKKTIRPYIAYYKCLHTIY